MTGILIHEIDFKDLMVMKTNQDIAIEEVLHSYQALFENLSLEVVEKDFLAIFAEQVHFKDPFNETYDLASLQKIFRHMFTTLQQPKFTVLHTAGAGKTGYLDWQFDFNLKPEGKAQQIKGLSKILINDQQQVIAHIEYWDAGEFVYSKVPILRNLVGLVNRRLSVN